MGYEYQINHNDTSTGNLSGWGAWQRIGTGWATVNHMIGGLTNGREYRFHLRALSIFGASAAAPNAAPWFASATPQEFDNRLVVSSVTGDSAIMNATGYPSKWWYARLGDPANSQCAGRLRAKSQPDRADREYAVRIPDLLRRRAA